MSEINLAPGEVPERMWYIDRRNNISRNETFSGSPDGFIKEMKVINRTPAGWRGICVTFNPNSEYARAYSLKNYLFFRTKDDARKYLISLLAKRNDQLNAARDRCSEMMLELMRLRNEQN